MGTQGLLGSIYSWITYIFWMLQHRYVGWPAVNRKTGEWTREQQPLQKKLKLMLLFNPLLEWIDETAQYRRYLHKKTFSMKKKEESSKSKEDILAFIEEYHIDMSHFEPSDWRDYPTFQEFFIRHHKPGSRPTYAEDDDSVAIIPSDSRATVYETVSEARRLWIKGHGWSVGKILQDNELAKPWADGAVACFRLSPQDYHRYHSPVSGTVEWDKCIPGEYYGVDPMAVSSKIDVLGENTRHCVCIDSPDFGNVLFVAVGAEDVGTVKLNEKFTTKSAQVKKGDEVGIFEFGGSSIVVAFEKGRVEWDDDLLHWSRKGIMVDVEVGMGMGRAVKP